LKGQFGGYVISEMLDGNSLCGHVVLMVKCWEKCELPKSVLQKKHGI